MNLAFFNDKTPVNNGGKVKFLTLKGVKNEIYPTKKRKNFLILMN